MTRFLFTFLKLIQEFFKIVGFDNSKTPNN